MSLFDKDIIERPLEIPKKLVMEHVLRWITNQAQQYLINKKENMPNYLSLTDFRVFSINYLKMKYDEFFGSLMLNETPKNIPQECKEFPIIKSYDVKVTMGDQIAQLSSDPHLMVMDTFSIDIKYVFLDEEDMMMCLKQFLTQIAV